MLVYDELVPGDKVICPPSSVDVPEEINWPPAVTDPILSIESISVPDSLKLKLPLPLELSSVSNTISPGDFKLKVEVLCPLIVPIVPMLIWPSFKVIS